MKVVRRAKERKRTEKTARNRRRKALFISSIANH